MQKTISIKTSKQEEMLNITEEISKAIKESKVEDGICIIYTPHTTAGITINESTDPDVRTDILLKLNELAEDNRYKHGEGNSDSHVKSTIVGCSKTIIINSNKPLLGTWQAIYFCEFDGPRTRQITIKILKN